MASNEQVDKQCQQLLNDLSSCVNGALVPQIHDISSEQRQLQQEITDTRVALIRTTLGTLLSKLNATRNKYSPISRLVDEILIEIWSYTGAYDRFSISEVCQRWRCVSLGAAKLWTEINLDTLASNRLIAALRRCGNAPLRIVGLGRRFSSESLPEQYYNNQRYVQRVDERGWCESGRRGTIINEVAGYRDESDAKIDEPVYLGLHRSTPSVPRDVLHKMALRAKSIRATVGRNDSYYMSYDILNTPAPLLQELFLSVERQWNLPSLDYSPEDSKTESGKWFNGVTPLLRVLDLSTIHAPWNDPVYSNLTSLRLNAPQIKIQLPELLRILRRCPTLEFLDLTDCFSSPRASGLFGTFGGTYPSANQVYSRPIADTDHFVEESNNPVSSCVVLHNLQYLHIDESDPAVYTDLLSRISFPALQTLVVCSPDLECLTQLDSLRGTQRPVESLHSIFSRTTQLQLSLGEYGQLTMIGRSNAAVEHDKYTYTGFSGRLRRVPGPGWSFSSKRQLTHSSSGQSEDEFINFLERLDFLGVSYDQVELIDITGQRSFGNKFYHDLFARCFRLKRLHLRPYPRFLIGNSTFGGGGYALYNHAGLLRMTGESGMQLLTRLLEDKLCLHLEEVYLTQFSSPASELASWVEMRGGGLKKVVIDVFNDIRDGIVMSKWMEDASELDEESKRRIERVLEKSGGDGLVWRNNEKEKYLEYQGENDEQDRSSLLWKDWL
ncbi:hypothetical protein FRC17_010082 [Serendipita sp. 399]|nr:hypothetical protein FRC17_010082 [Serendipita sp. 399]